jgi:hypothetical protein
MPRFFINVRSGNMLVEDPEGYNLPDLEAAREEALAAAREIMADGLKAEKLDCDQLEIHDKTGQFLTKVLIRDICAGC